MVVMMIMMIMMMLIMTLLQSCGEMGVPRVDKKPVTQPQAPGDVSRVTCHV